MTQNTTDDRKLVHAATATADGGQVRTEDGVLEVALAVAGEGSGTATSPEHLMAAALAGCLQQAVRLAASSLEDAGSDPTVDATVTLRAGDGGGYSASFDLVVKGLQGEHADDVLTEAVGLCPFTGALEGPALTVSRG